MSLGGNMLAPTVETLIFVLLISGLSVRWAFVKRTHDAVVLACLGVMLPVAWSLDALDVANSSLVVRIIVVGLLVTWVVASYLLLRAKCCNKVTDLP